MARRGERRKKEERRGEERRGEEKGGRVSVCLVRSVLRVNRAAFLFVVAKVSQRPIWSGLLGFPGPLRTSDPHFLSALLFLV